MIHRTMIVCAVGLLACRGRDEKCATPAPAAPVLAHATQADLAREIDDAEHHGTWSEVRRRWQGQQLHWTVTRQRSLCRSESACNIAPFPIQRPATHGWLPGLSFAPGEFHKIEAGCGNAEQCELVIEGTLSELELSPEMPTSLKFQNVKVVTAKHA